MRAHILGVGVLELGLLSKDEVLLHGGRVSTGGRRPSVRLCHDARHVGGVPAAETDVLHANVAALGGEIRYLLPAAQARAKLQWEGAILCGMDVMSYDLCFKNTHVL